MMVRGNNEQHFIYTCHGDRCPIQSNNINLILIGPKFKMKLLVNDIQFSKVTLATTSNYWETNKILMYVSKELAPISLPFNSLPLSLHYCLQ